MFLGLHRHRVLHVPGSGRLTLTVWSLLHFNTHCNKVSIKHFLGMHFWLNIKFVIQFRLYKFIYTCKERKQEKIKAVLSMTSELNALRLAEPHHIMNWQQVNMLSLKLMCCVWGWIMVSVPMVTPQPKYLFHMRQTQLAQWGICPLIPTEQCRRGHSPFSKGSRIQKRAACHLCPTAMRSSQMEGNRSYPSVLSGLDISGCKWTQVCLDPPLHRGEWSVWMGTS